MKHIFGLIFFICATAGYAQDKATLPPADIGGFRLDPPPAQEKPKPLGTPKAEIPVPSGPASPPKVVSPQKEAPPIIRSSQENNAARPAQPQASQRGRMIDKQQKPQAGPPAVRNTPAPKPVAPQLPSTPEPSAAVAPATRQDAQNKTIAEPENAQPSQAKAVEAEATAPAIPFWLASLLGGLGLLGLACLFFFLRQRQASASKELEAEAEAGAVPDPVPTLRSHSKSAPPKITPAASAQGHMPKPPKSLSDLAHNGQSKPDMRSLTPKPQPQLEMRFTPDSVIIGIANITLRGVIHIVNHGRQDARDIRFASSAISASQSQLAQMEAFHEGAHMLTQTSLENITAGKRLMLDIEIMLPKHELHSFHIEGREICVPVVLAALSWSDADHMRQESRLVTLIGPEGDIPGGKLGAFRLDTGPRSFSGLGQRRLFA